MTSRGAIAAGHPLTAEAGAQDTVLSRIGTLDVLAQHVLGMACQASFDPSELFEEVRTALPYAGLDRRQFDRVVDFVATGGYALKAYDRWQRLKQTQGKWHLRDPRAAALIRQNLGTIIDIETLKSRVMRGP